MRKWHASRDSNVVRTAGVHAGRGDCNRAVEVCVSGFGNPNRNRGGDNPGERFQRVQRLVGFGRVLCSAGCRRGETHKKGVTRIYIQAMGEELKNKERKPNSNIPGLEQRRGFLVMTREKRTGRMEGDSSLFKSGQARRNESSRGGTGEWEVGGEGVKRVQQAQPIWEAQSSEEGSSLGSGRENEENVEVRKMGRGYGWGTAR